MPPGIDPTALDAKGKLIVGDRVIRDEVEVMVRLPTLQLPAQIDVVRRDGKHLGRVLVE